MTCFVGAEYIIASMLIEKAKFGKKTVSLSELNRYGVSVQQEANNHNIDAVFLTSQSQLYSAVYDFSDYFTCQFDENGMLVNIMIESTKNITDLEYRFMGFLSKTISEILFEVAKKIA